MVKAGKGGGIFDWKFWSGAQFEFDKFNQLTVVSWCGFVKLDPFALPPLFGYQDSVQKCAASPYAPPRNGNLQYSQATWLVFFLKKKDDQSFPHWSKRAQGVPWIWMQAFLVEDGNWKHACVSSTCVLNTMMMLIMMAIAPCLQACVLHAHHYCVVREQGHFSTPGDWPYWLLKGINFRKGTIIIHSQCVKWNRHTLFLSLRGSWISRLPIKAGEIYVYQYICSL